MLDSCGYMHYTTVEVDSTLWLCHIVNVNPFNHSMLYIGLTSSAYWDDPFYRLTFYRCHPSKGSDLSQNYHDVRNIQN